MKITKSQLRRIIKEEKAKLINEDAFDNVMRIAYQIMGADVELDEEMDGNIIIVADEMDVEAHYDQLMDAFPNGEMVEDGFVTGVMQESKITKRQLRRIIKEERTKLLRESIADMTEYQDMMENYANNISDKFYEDMMKLFEEEPEAFEGSSRLDWDQQVVYAQQELDTGIVAAIEKVIQEVEMQLHDGQYFDDR